MPLEETPLSGELRLSTALDEIVIAYERSWREGMKTPIEEFLPREEPLRRRVLLELTHIELENRIKAGEPARVEEYLGRFADLADDSDSLLDLLQAEFRHRSARQTDVSLAEYAERFPALADKLAAKLPAVVDLMSTGRWSMAHSQESTMPSAAQTAAHPWPKIDGLEFQQVLGKGGMGIVYLARQVELNRPVAVKMILAHEFADGDERSRFQREAEIVAQLDHANIVKIHAIGEYQGNPYLVLEYVSGGSLARNLAGMPQDPQPAAQLVATLARAMDHVHQRGVVHRDLKPANVLLSGVRDQESGVSTSAKAASLIPDSCLLTPIPKISDFGLARLTEADTLQTRTGAILGTPSYMAPEQALAQAGKIGPTTDVYALGAILYEMLTGRPPFKCPTILETLEQVRSMEPVPPRTLQPKCPRDLETIALKCLQKEVTKRYSSAAELADDLDRFLSGRPVHARPVGPVEKTWRWCRRRPAAAALVACLVLLVAGAVAGLLWYQNDRARQALAKLRQQQAQVRRAAKAQVEIENALAKSETLLKETAADFGNIASWHNKLVQADSSIRLAESVSAADKKLLPPSLLNRIGDVRKRWASLKEDHKIVSRLHTIHLDIGRVNVLTSQFETSGSYPKILEALRDYGLPVAGIPVTEAIAKLEKRPKAIQQHFIAALETVLLWNPKEETRKRDWVLGVLDALDSDDWRRRIRRTIALRQWPKLKNELRAVHRQLREVNLGKQSPEFFIFLAKSLPADLSDAKLDLLRRIQRAAPGDFWANHELGFALAFGRSPRWSEAARYFRACVALMPENGGMHLNLGYVLEELGETDDAEHAYREAVRLGPKYVAAYFNLSVVLHKQGRLEEAETVARQALDLPAHPRGRAIAHAGLAVVLRDRRKFDEAVREAKTAIAILEEDNRKTNHHEIDRLLIGCHLKLGTILAAKKDFDTADKVFRDAVEMDPKYFKSYQTFGQALQLRGDRVHAAEQYRHALQLNPNHVAAATNLGMILKELGKLNEAKKVLLGALRIDPASVHAHVNLGAVLYLMKKPDEAAYHIRYAIELSPNTAEAYLNLATIENDRKNHAAALKHLQKAVAVRRDFDLGYRNLAETYLTLRQYRPAAAAVKKALALNPRNTDYLLLAGEIFEKSKNFKKAAEVCAKALAIDDSNTQAHYQLGVAQCHLGQETDALRAFQKALALDPDYAAAWLNVGYLQRKLHGDLDAAIAASKKAVALNPKLGEAFVNLGIALAEIGKKEEAVAAYRRAVAVDPNNAEFHRYLADGLAATGETAERIKALRTAVKLNPKNRAAYVSLGIVLTRERDPSALEVCRKIVAAFPDEPSAYVNLAAGLQQTGRLQEALDVCRTGLEKVPANSRFRPVLQRALNLAARWVQLEAKLAKIVGSNAKPANPTEAIEYLAVCTFKEHYAIGAKLAADAFAAQPKLADDIKRGYRYKAARCAALAGTGNGKDGAKLTPKEKAQLRRQAQGWLRAEIEAWEKLLKVNPAVAETLTKLLAKWQQDRRLACVREAKALATFDKGESAKWRQLWADVQALRTSARSRFSKTSLFGFLTAKQPEKMHPLTLKAGRRYVIEMRSGHFDTFLYLRDSKGRLLAKNDDINPRNRNSGFVINAHNDGEARLIAASYESRGRGAYQLIIREYWHNQQPAKIE